MASNKYMTVDQLAERWMCSPSYVRTLLRSGQLSAVKIAGWKVRQDEVLRFEKAKEQADTEALRQQRIGYIRVIILSQTERRGQTMERYQNIYPKCPRRCGFDAGKSSRDAWLVGAESAGHRAGGPDTYAGARG